MTAGHHPNGHAALGRGAVGGDEQLHPLGAEQQHLGEVDDQRGRRARLNRAGQGVVEGCTGDGCGAEVDLSGQDDNHAVPDPAGGGVDVAPTGRSPDTIGCVSIVHLAEYRKAGGRIHPANRSQRGSAGRWKVTVVPVSDGTTSMSSVRAPIIDSPRPR